MRDEKTELGKSSEVEAYTLAALEQDRLPDLERPSPFWRDVAIRMIASGRPTLARGALTRARALGEPDSSLRRIEAGLLLAEGAWSEALVALRPNLAEQAPPSEGPFVDWLNASAAALVGGQWELAEQAAATALKLGPSSAAAWANLFTAREARGAAPVVALLAEAIHRHAGSDELMARVVARGQVMGAEATTEIRALTRAFLAAGRLVEAVEMTQLAAASSKDILHDILDAASRDEADGVAADCAARLLASDPADVPARAALLEIAVKAGDFAAARRIGMSLLEERLSPYQEALLAFSCAALGEEEEARQLLDLNLARTGVEARIAQLRRRLEDSTDADGDAGDAEPRLVAQAALLLLDGAIAQKRWGVGLMCGQQLADLVDEPRGAAHILDGLATLFEAHGRPIEALAALTLADRADAGYVSEERIDDLLVAIGATAAEE